MPTLQQEIEFCNLLSRNNTTINSVCLQFCDGNAFYFDELRQECALAIWDEFSRHGMGRFQGNSSESTWIYRISYHAAVIYLRDPKNKEFKPLADVYNTEIIERDNGQDDWRLLDELRECLDNRELNMLDHYLSDTSYSAIARTEGITEATARKRMSRLKEKLKKLIYKNK